MVLIECENRGGSDFIKGNILKIFLIPWGIRHSSFGYIKMAISGANNKTPGPLISIIHNKDDRNDCLDDAHNVTVEKIGFLYLFQLHGSMLMISLVYCSEDSHYPFFC